MKILTLTSFRYYGHRKAIEPQFYYLYRVPLKMGFDVDFFDYQAEARRGVERMRLEFIDRLQSQNYDVVFVATHQDEFDYDTLAAARRLAPLIAWNSDDEWRWEGYSSRYVTAYSYMVTNSPDVYAAERRNHPNLLHAQWACTGFWDGRGTRKDIDFSFVGQVYGTRAEQIAILRERVGLQAYGKGAADAVASRRRWRRLLDRVPLLTSILGDDTITFEQVNALWNRSKVSFTPLDSSSGGVRQIKSRVFDVGLSGTVMLAHRAPHLDEYYEPGKEYEPFDTLEECAEKAEFYVRTEAARKRIAAAYARRTLADHMWEHRIRHVLTEASLLPR